jgi:hypothetical protein
MTSVTEFVKRPGLGRVGRSIRVRANYFEITEFPSSNIYHYDIIIAPEVPPAMNRKIFHTAENSFGVKTVFDGRRNIYTVRPFPFSDAHSLDVTLPEDDTVSAGRRPSRTFKIRIRKVAEIIMEEIIRFLDGHGSISPNILTG